MTESSYLHSEISFNCTMAQFHPKKIILGEPKCKNDSPLYSFRNTEELMFFGLE